MAIEPQTLTHIPDDDDPEVRRVLLGLRKGIYPVTEIISEGLHGRTLVYEHVESGLLSTFVSGNRRCAYAIDYARYLVALKRIGEARANRHHLARPSNRPAHDPKRQVA